MILSVKRTSVLSLSISAALICAAFPSVAQKQPKPDKPIVKAMAGPRATILRITPIYVAPDVTTQKVDRIAEGREMVIAETSGPWIRVFANTDFEEVSEKDAPIYGQETAPPPVSGWMQAHGVIRETTPDGDKVLMGEAASMEILA